MKTEQILKFFELTAEPVTRDVLTEELGITEKALYNMVYRLRRRGNDIWTIHDGTVTRVFTKKRGATHNTFGKVRELLEEGEHTLDELASKLYRTTATISKHIHKLRDEGLIEVRYENNGTPRPRHVYRLKEPK